MAFAGQLAQRQVLLQGASRHQNAPQEYHLAVSAVGPRVGLGTYCGECGAML